MHEIRGEKVERNGQTLTWMFQVRSFQEGSAEVLDQEINHWLHTQEVRVVDIKYSHTAQLITPQYGSDYQVYSFSAMVMCYVLEGTFVGINVSGGE